MVKNKKLNIAMAGWWTWWHVFPILSLIKFMDSEPEYNEKINKIYRFWSDKSLEKDVHSKLDTQNFKTYFVHILSGKYRRETILKSRLKNIRDIFLFIVGIFQAFFFILIHRIDVIFCKGWYVALPVVFAWALLRKKILVHESDTRSGLVNKIAVKFAKYSFTWFPEVLPGAKCVWQIISDDLVLSTSDDKEMEQKLFKDKQKPDFSSKTCVFVTWGSQWSQKLYQMLSKIIKSDQTIQSDYLFFISLWVLNAQLASEFRWLKNVYSYPFLRQDEMWYFYKNCDVAITRAGTTSLAEQKLFDLKIIMIPIPWTHDQYDNAKRYVRSFGDILVDQKDKNYENNLKETILSLNWFKKRSSKKNLKDEVGKAKMEIVQKIINSN